MSTLGKSIQDLIDEACKKTREDERRKILSMLSNDNYTKELKNSYVVRKAIDEHNERMRGEGRVQVMQWLGEWRTPNLSERDFRTLVEGYERRLRARLCARDAEWQRNRIADAAERGVARGKKRRRGNK